MAKINYNEIKVSAARTAIFNNIKNVIEEINIHKVLKLSSGENLPIHQMITGKHSVFGHVIAGQEVVDAITTLKNKKEHNK